MKQESPGFRHGECQDSECGIEIVGIFDNEDKAYSAKAEVETWMESNGYKDYEIFVSPMDINHIAWHEINKKF